MKGGERADSLCSGDLCGGGSGRSIDLGRSARRAFRSLVRCSEAARKMNFHIVTIFPEFFDGPFQYGVVGKAQSASLLDH